MPRLSTFIRENTEEILSEWETFARSLPMGDSMDVVALRDHAKEMLGVIARDLDTPQTRRQQVDKSKGKRDAPERTAPTAAQEHGAGRAESGFTVAQMVSEFRALRSSVMHLWTRKQRDVGIEDIEDMIRFNEGIDQAIAESVTRHTHEIGQSKERFLAILGHDLRTPLSAIITSTRFMLDTDELREPYLTLVTRVASSARRMNQMVADLLEFTRTRFGDSIPIVRTDDGVRDRRHLGLGLYIVDKIVAAHGGSIDVRSSKERGTTFTVHLPRRV
jgi:signal transduction histidine kinase